MLIPLLFVIVMDDITKDVREGGVKELLYADGLVLLGDSWEEVEMRYAQWKKTMTEKRLKVNVIKTKAFCTGKRTVAMKTSKFPCSVYRIGVERNFISCIKSNCWVNKRRSCIQKCLSTAVDSVNRKCFCSTGSTNADEEVTLNSDVIEKVV